MKKSYILLLLLGIVINLFSRNPLQPAHYAAQGTLANVIPEMNSAGFWIARHPYPDSLIMNSAQIAKFNQRVNKQGTVTRIWEHSSRFSGVNVRKSLNQILGTIKALAKYDSTGSAVSSATWDSLKTNMAIDKVALGIKVRFGFPLRFTSQRLAPTKLNLNKEVLDTEFDELQNSGYDIGTPSVFYHDSADGNWVFGACSTSTGWYLKNDICLLSQKDWLAYQNAAAKVVCLVTRGDLWSDSLATEYLTFCRMGTSFPLLGETAEYYQISIPQKDGLGTAYLAKSDATKGFLPFTARNVYKQAFKTLNMPYGWGDTAAEWDCSSLLKSVFASFGITLPRNGLQQVKACKLLHDFGPVDNEARRDSLVIAKGLPGFSLLRLNGHIMLYLGSYKGHAFALHDTWGFRKPATDTTDDTYVLNKTVVSDLYLSQNSQRGSLLKRLTTLAAVN